MTVPPPRSTTREKVGEIPPAWRQFSGRAEFHQPQLSATVSFAEGDTVVPDELLGRVQQLKERLTSLLPTLGDRTLRQIAYRSSYPPGVLSRAIDPSNPRLPNWPPIEALLRHTGNDPAKLEGTWNRIAQDLTEIQARAREVDSEEDELLFPCPLPKIPEPLKPREVPKPLNEEPPPDPSQVRTAAELVTLVQQLQQRADFSVRKLSERIKHDQGNASGVKKSTLSSFLGKQGKLPSDRQRYEVIITACDPHLALAEWRAAWDRAMSAPQAVDEPPLSTAPATDADQQGDPESASVPTDRSLSLRMAMSFLFVFLLGVLVGVVL